MTPGSLVPALFDCARQSTSQPARIAPTTQAGTLGEPARPFADCCEPEREAGPLHEPEAKAPIRDPIAALLLFVE